MKFCLANFSRAVTPLLAAIPRMHRLPPYKTNFMNLNRREFIQATAAATVAATLAPAWAQAEKKITVALVGGAHIHTPGFVDLVKKRPDVTVKWVWDHDAARAAKLAQELGAEPVPDLAKPIAP